MTTGGQVRIGDRRPPKNLFLRLINAKHNMQDSEAFQASSGRHLSGTSTVGSKAAFASVESSPATPTRGRSTTHWNQRWHAVIVSCSFLLLMGIVAMIATQFSATRKLSKTPQTVISTPDISIHAGKITNEADGRGCFQQQFDNKTGRLTQLHEPCETVARDNSGVPIPVGTIHRLDAISKGFSGR